MNESKFEENVTICPSIDDIVENYELSALANDTDQSLLYALIGISIIPLSFNLFGVMTERT